MTAPTVRPAVELDRTKPPATTLSKVAFVLALLAVPGVVMTWDVVPGGGFATGVPLAIVAVVLGLRARPARLATPAVAIAGVCIAFVAFWTIASAF